MYEGRDFRCLKDCGLIMTQIIAIIDYVGMDDRGDGLEVGHFTEPIVGIKLDRLEDKE